MSPQPVKTLIIRLLGDSSRFERELRRAEYRLRRFSAQAAQSVAVMASATIAATTAASAKSLEMAAQFEKDMNRVTTVMSSGSTAMEKYSDDVLKIVEETSHGVTDITESAYQILSASFPEKELIKTLDLAVKAATAGFTTPARAVDVITSTVNAYARSNLEASTAVDVLMKTQQRGKTTLEEMAWSLANVTPIASALNVSFQDVAASLVLLTRSGTKTAPATAQLRTLFRDMAFEHTKLGEAVATTMGAPITEILKEGESFATALEQTRIRVGDKPFIELFTNVEAMQAALRVVGVEYENFLEISHVMNNEAVGELNRAFDVMADGALYTALVIRNKLYVAMIKLGLEALPAVTDMLQNRVLPELERFTSDEGLQKAVEWVERLASWMLRFAGFAMRFGEGMAFIYKHAGVLAASLAAVGVGAFASGIVTLGMVLVTLGKIITAHPLFYFVTLLTGLIAAVGWVNKEFGELPAALVAIAGALALVELALWSLAPAAAVALAPWTLLPAAIAAALAAFIMFDRKVHGFGDPSLPLELQPTQDLGRLTMDRKLNEAQARLQFLEEEERRGTRQDRQYGSLPIPDSAEMQRLREYIAALQKQIRLFDEEARVRKEMIYRSGSPKGLVERSSLDFAPPNPFEKLRNFTSPPRWMEGLAGAAKPGGKGQQTGGVVELWIDRLMRRIWPNFSKIVEEAMLPANAGGAGAAMPLQQMQLMRKQMEPLEKEWGKGWYEIHRTLVDIGESAQRKFHELWGWMLPGGELEEGAGGLQGLLASLWNRVKGIWASVFQRGVNDEGFSSRLLSPSEIMELTPAPDALLPPVLRDETKPLPVTAEITPVAAPDYVEWLIPWLQRTKTVLANVNAVLRIFGIDETSTWWSQALTTAEKIVAKAEVILSEAEAGDSSLLHVLFASAEIARADAQVFFEAKPESNQNQWVINILKDAEPIFRDLTLKAKGETDKSWTRIVLEGANVVDKYVNAWLQAKIDTGEGEPWMYTALKILTGTEEWQKDLEVRLEAAEASGDSWLSAVLESRHQLYADLLTTLRASDASDTDLWLADILEAGNDTIEALFKIGTAPAEGESNLGWLFDILKAVKSVDKLVRIIFGLGEINEEDNWITDLLQMILGFNTEEGLGAKFLLDIGGRTATGWDWVTNLLQGIAKILIPTLELVIKTTDDSPISSDQLTELMGGVDLDKSVKLFFKSGAGNQLWMSSANEMFQPSGHDKSVTLTFWFASGNAGEFTIDSVNAIMDGKDTPKTITLTVIKGTPPTGQEFPTDLLDKIGAITASAAVRTISLGVQPAVSSQSNTYFSMAQLSVLLSSVSNTLPAKSMNLAISAAPSNQRDSYFTVAQITNFMDGTLKFPTKNMYLAISAAVSNQRDAYFTVDQMRAFMDPSATVLATKSMTLEISAAVSTQGKTFISTDQLALLTGTSSTTLPDKTVTLGVQAAASTTSNTYFSMAQLSLLLSTVSATLPAKSIKLTFTSSSNLFLMSEAQRLFEGGSHDKTVNLLFLSAQGSQLWMSPANELFGQSGHNKSVTITFWASFGSTARGLTTASIQGLFTVGDADKKLTITSDLAGDITTAASFNSVLSDLKTAQSKNLVVGISTSITGAVTTTTNLAALFASIISTAKLGKQTVNVEINTTLKGSIASRSYLDSILEDIKNAGDKTIDIDIDTTFKGAFTRYNTLASALAYIGLRQDKDIDVDVTTSITGSLTYTQVTDIANLKSAHSLQLYMTSHSATPNWIDNFLKASYGGNRKRRSVYSMPIEFDAKRYWDTNPLSPTYQSWVTHSPEVVGPKYVVGTAGSTGASGSAGPGGPGAGGSLSVTVNNPVWLGREDLETTIRDVIRTMQREGALPKPVYN